MTKNVNYEKNIVNYCPGMKYGNLKKWTTKKILGSNKKSQYRLSSISIYMFYTRNILPMLIRCYQQFGRRKIILHARILGVMFATSIIRAWKTIPMNIQKDKIVRDEGQRKRNIQSLYCSQDNY